MHIGHGQEVCGVAVHDNAVCGIHLQPRDVAHHVGGELRGELAAVFKTPEEFGGFAAVDNADQTEVHFRRVLDVLEVLAGAGNEEKLPVQFRSLEPRGDRADDCRGVDIVFNLLFIEQQGDVAAVAFVPAVGIHVGGGSDHLDQVRCFQKVFHDDSPYDQCCGFSG